MADVEKIYKNDSKLKKSDVEALREWAAKQPHLPEITELQAILFLQSCYYSNEMAKTTIDNYFTVKTLCPDIFGNRNPKNPIISNWMNIALFRTLPKLTPDGNAAVYMKFMDSNPERFNFANQVRIFDMSVLLFLHLNGPVEGTHLIFDMDGSTFGHLARLNIVVMRKFLYYLQEAMPIRLVGLHYINVMPFLDKILALMKPFMKKQLIDAIHVHGNSMDTLYEYVPKECLPANLGGTVDTINILHEKMKRDINENAEYFQWEDTQTVDESKRPGKPKDAGDFFGVEGTFKKLEVD